VLSMLRGNCSCGSGGNGPIEKAIIFSLFHLPPAF
jgi:hypothetical protein